MDEGSIPSAATISEDPEALTNAPDKSLLIEAMRKEVLGNLIEKSRALQPISDAEEADLKKKAAKDGRKVWNIGPVVKCKRKTRGDGTIEKRKARTAMRGDILKRMMLKAKVPMPPTFSPTIRAITFAFLLQLAVMKGLVMFTTDLAYAYLNAIYGEDLDPTSHNWSHLFRTFVDYLADRNIEYVSTSTDSQMPAELSISFTRRN